MPLSTTAPESKIRRLDTRLINQIAAGEVIVRPASAVKELVENSLDAGATRIEVAVEEDARSFWIRDDGSGMTEDDARLSVERYATSKIREFDDLMHLLTRGFRGEALAAISSVSRFEMLTRRPEDDGGVELKSEGGQNVRIAAAGAPPGTTIRVRDLFYNTPARMKFLRTPVVEWGYILREFTRQALTRADVAFAIKWRGQPYLTLPGNQSIADRLRAILPGENIELLDIDQTVHGVRAWGCIGSPKATRRDRRYQYFFANGRPIVSRPLTFSLQEAYRGLIMTQQYPVGAIFLEIPGEEIDVNVHPTKEEVRFKNEPLAAGAIHRAALEALRKADLVPRIDLPSEPGRQFAQKAMGQKWSQPNTNTVSFFKSPEPVSDGHEKVEARLNETIDSPPLPLAAPASRAEPVLGAPREQYADEAASQESTLIGQLLDAPVPPRVLAQVEETYILADAPGLGILLIDQHAAHEKILYLDYMRRRGARDVQPLLVPFTFEAAASEIAAMEALTPALTEEGFEVAHFGGGTFVVQAIPAIFERIDVAAFLRDLLDEIGAGDLRREIEGVRHRIGARAACRAAVKAGDPLSLPEMERLLDQVLQTSEALRCPHGRPTLVLLSKESLDRRFGRI